MASHLRKGFGGSVAVLDDLEQVLYVFVTQMNFDGNHLEVAEASDLRGWAFDPCRSPRGFPVTQQVLSQVLSQTHQKLILIIYRSPRGFRQHTTCLYQILSQNHQNQRSCLLSLLQHKR